MVSLLIMHEFCHSEIPLSLIGAHDYPAGQFSEQAFATAHFGIGVHPERGRTLNCTEQKKPLSVVSFVILSLGDTSLLNSRETQH